MNILLKSKKDVETQFGKQSVLANNLMNMIQQGEKAYSVATGSMSDGFNIIFGVFNNVVRYVAFQKRSGKTWTEADTRSVLMQVGDWANWASKPGSDFCDYAEKDATGKTVIASCTGWVTAKKRYCFLYVPVVAGQISLVPDRGAMNNRF